MSIKQILSEHVNVGLPEETAVWDLSSDRAAETFEALSSGTARAILEKLYAEPRTASDLADSIDSSLQNVDYHLQNLLEADLIEVGDIQYSETGNEMKIYRPSRNAVLLLSRESTARRIRSQLTNLFGWILLVGIGAVLFRWVTLKWVLTRITMSNEAGDGSGQLSADEADAGGANARSQDLPQEGASGLEVLQQLDQLPILVDPAVAFLAGGVFAIVLFTTVQMLRRQT